MARCSGCWPAPGCCAGSSTTSGWSTTFATNLRGPAQPLTLAGAPLRAIIPIANTAGNVPVTFAALSYAGTLWLTVLSDPAHVPDVAALTAALRQELPPAPG